MWETAKSANQLLSKEELAFFPVVRKKNVLNNYHPLQVWNYLMKFSSAFTSLITFLITHMTIIMQKTINGSIKFFILKIFLHFVFFTDKTPLRAQKRIILSFKLPRFYFDMFYSIFLFKYISVLSRNFKTISCNAYFLGWIVSSPFVENSACSFAAHIFVERVRSLKKLACS